MQYHLIVWTFSFKQLIKKKNGFSYSRGINIVFQTPCRLLMIDSYEKIIKSEKNMILRCAYLKGRKGRDRKNINEGLYRTNFNLLLNRFD